MVTLRSVPVDKKIVAHVIFNLINTVIFRVKVRVEFWLTPWGL